MTHIAYERKPWKVSLRFGCISLAGFTRCVGYGLTSVVSATSAELFHGKHYGTIFGALSMSAGLDAAGAPWITGIMYDWFGSYTPAWWLVLDVSVVSLLCIWCAPPRRVRAVAGQIDRLHARQR